jgi:RNA polymerase sigma-70 factor (ECF subfamily)
VPDSAAFVRDTEPFRRELLAHCYRMVGSVPDAEDVVQETYLRAWRSYDGFEGRSSMRTWLYRIATNACLTALTKHERRVLPSGLSDQEPDYTKAPVAAGPEVSWLQPIPDALVSAGAFGGGHLESADPAAIVAERGNLRLALIASLQYLPARQRAVLVLRDVLAFPAAEVAGMLGMTLVSVKSALQRARARLRELAPVADEIAEPDAPQARELLNRYIAAFENADAAELERLLLQDVTLEATPFAGWFRGLATCVPFLRAHVLGSPGYWRMRATRANGQPAATCFTLGQDGTYHPYGVVVLTVARGGISEVVSFGDPALVPAFAPDLFLAPFPGPGEEIRLRDDEEGRQPLPAGGQAVPVGVGDRLRAVTRADLRQQVVDMALHRGLAHHQPGRDVTVRQALGDQREYLGLPSGEAVRQRGTRRRARCR